MSIARVCWRRFFRLVFLGGLAVSLLHCHPVVVKRKKGVQQQLQETGNSQLMVPNPFVESSNSHITVSLEFTSKQEQQVQIAFDSDPQMSGLVKLYSFLLDNNQWFLIDTISGFKVPGEVTLSCIAGRTIRLIGETTQSKQIQLVTVKCPPNINFENDQHFAQFREMLAKHDTIYLGYLYLPSGRKFEIDVASHKRIHIGQIVVMRKIGQESPPILKFRTSEQSLAYQKLVALGIKSQEEKWNSYPEDKNSLVGEIYSNFLKDRDPIPSSLEEWQEKFVPRVYVTVNRVQDKVFFVSETRPGPDGFSGEQLAPNFFRNRILVDAPNGRKGDDASPIAGIAFVCAVHSGAGNGGNGENGRYPGIAGTDGFPPLVGPTLGVFTPVLQESGRHLITVTTSAKIANPSKGGKGTRGQNGGKGGPGGRAACPGHSDGRRGSDGQAAPAGADGKLSLITEFCPKLMFAGVVGDQENSVVIAPSENSCKTTSPVSATARLFDSWNQKKSWIEISHQNLK